MNMGILMYNFCIFIISHGRSNNVITYDTLVKAGNTYPVYVVIDNLDKTKNDYINTFGKDKVIIFDKELYAKDTDNGDNFWDLRTTSHARNACFDIAENLGHEYFIVLDDDYTDFKFRINNYKQHPNNKFKIYKTIDNVFNAFLKYYISIQALSITFSQGGDWFGGGESFGKSPKRKAMNSFFCSINRRFKFISRLNEDVNTYMTIGSVGGIFLTIPHIMLTQLQTQSNQSGMTDTYLEYGTYVKSFYTVMYAPSCVKVAMMGESNRRLHHKTNWNNAVPKILNEKYKKYNVLSLTN